MKFKMKIISIRDIKHFEKADGLFVCSFGFWVLNSISKILIIDAFVLLLYVLWCYGCVVRCSLFVVWNTIFSMTPKAKKWRV